MLSRSSLRWRRFLASPLPLCYASPLPLCYASPLLNVCSMQALYSTNIVGAIHQPEVSEQAAVNGKGHTSSSFQDSHTLERSSGRSDMRLRHGPADAKALYAFVRSHLQLLSPDTIVHMLFQFTALTRNSQIERTLRLLAGLLPDHLHSMSDSQVVLALSSISKLKLPDEAVMASLLTRIYSRLDTFCVHDLVRVAVACSKLHVKNDLLFSNIARLCLPLTNNLKPGEMSALLHSFAKLSYQNYSRLFIAICASAKSKLSEFKAGEIGLLLTGASLLHIYHPPLMQAVHDKYSDPAQLLPFNSMHFTQLLLALARFNRPLDAPLCVAIRTHRRVLASTPPLSPSLLYPFLLLLPLAPSFDDVFRKILIDQFVANVTVFSQYELANIVTALAQIDLPPQSTVETALSERLQKEWLRTPSWIADFLWFYALPGRMQFKHEPIYRKLLDCYSKCYHRTLQDSLRVTASAARLGVWTDPCWNVLLDDLQRSPHSLSTSDSALVASLVEHLQSNGTSHPRAAELLSILQTITRYTHTRSASVPISLV